MVWVRRALIGVAALLVLVVVATAITGTVLVRRGFPQTSGEAELAALDADVEVLRDDHGVPTIVASSTDDLFRAQGYVHAQDRFFEMDFRRHVTAGRVAELFGADQVETDAFVRTLGWRRVAEQEVELLEDDTRAMLEAYAEGVNDWMQDRSGSQLSLEHALLPLTGAGGYEPEPWTAVDSVAWLKAMAWDLRANLEDELTRARLALSDLGPGRDWRRLFPEFPDRHPPILPEGGELADGEWSPAPALGGEDESDEDGSDADGSDDADEGDAPDAEAASDDEAAADDQGAAGPRRGDGQRAEVIAALDAAQQAVHRAPALMGPAGDGLGSNSWVVAPERSSTGSALLANDPHLGPAQPSLWHQVGLRCEPVGPDCPYHVAGFSFSGVPGIVIGHNADVGWGFTNLGADVADLVVERVHGERALTEDGWEPLETRTETIGVAGGDDVEHTVRETRHGPLLSDVSDGAAEIADGAGALPTDPGVTADDRSADASGGDDAAPQDDGEAQETGVEHAVALRWTALEPSATMDAIPRFMRADDWTSFREAASRFDVPSQNLVYADAQGHIGYQAPGRIPVRATGDGTMPLPGWTGEFGWERYRDFEELPWALDPDEGVIATANQPVLAPGEEPFLSRDHNVGYRAERIVELLDEQRTWSPDGLAAMQMDAHNGGGERLVPALTEVDDEGDGDVARMQEVLASWNLQDDATSAGAAAFNATWRHLLRLMFHPVLPEHAWPSGSADWWEVVGGLLDEPDSAWWHPPGDGPQGRDALLREAMAAAHDELVDRLGDDPAGWRWGRLHRLELTHQTFGTSGIAPLEALFNRGPLETSGGSDVVNATGWTASDGYEVDWVPSMRMVLDLGDLDAGRWVHLTGQSGRPFHPHYTDQAEAWRTGELLPIRFSAQAVDGAADERLTLSPDG